MAAGQQKKRLHASSVVSCDLQEHCGTKKKKNVISAHSFLNMKAHISLQWDENQQKVVAKREQIGITWRKLGPFLHPLPPRRKVLADVFAIPQEIFGLEDMTGVLSYEVWETQLSETEKSFLSQFLPKGADAEQVVQALLTGENLHFGNSFLRWGASLCSGKLHPDSIICQEQRFAAYQKAYDSELQNYHTEHLNDNMVENLQKLKETWSSCEGPERDVVEKNWRKGWADKCRKISTASERPKVVASSRKEEKPPRLYVRSGDGAKYMSYFKVTRKQHELVNGMNRRDGIKSKSLNHVLGDIQSFRVQPYEVYEEEESKKLHEHWLRLTNRDLPSAVTNWKERLLQKQHWSRSLGQEMKENRTSAYEGQDEKESPGSLLQKQRDIEDDEECSPRSSNSSPLQRIPSLNGCYECEPMDTEPEGGQEIFKLESASLVDSKFVGDTNPTEPLQRGLYEGEPMNTESEEGGEEIVKPDGASLVHSKFVGDTNPTEPLPRIPSLNGHYEIELMNTDSGEGSQEIFKQAGASPVLLKFVGDRNPTEIVEQKAFIHSAEGSVPYSTNSQLLQRIPSLNGHHGLDTLDMDLGESSQDIPKPDGAMQVLSQFVGNVDPTEDAIQHQVCLPSARDAWLEVGLTDSYYHHTPVNLGYTTSSELSLGQPHFITERPSHLFDLETDLINRDAKETLLHNASDDMMSGLHIDSGGSFPNSYTNRHRNELFQPFLKRQEMVPSRANDQRQVGLQFLGTPNVLLETGHCPGLLQEQQQQLLLERRQQMRESNCYMHQDIPKNMYSNSGRYTTPTQELFSPVNVQNLSGLAVSSSIQSLGSGSNADGSLYSALSQFNQPQSRPYNSMDTSEQGVGARNIVVGGGIASNSDVSGRQLNYTSGREAAAAAALKANNISWMNLPHPNSGLHDSIGKPFLSSWNL